GGKSVPGSACRRPARRRSPSLQLWRGGCDRLFRSALRSAPSHVRSKSVRFLGAGQTIDGSRGGDRISPGESRQGIQRCPTDCPRPFAICLARREGSNDLRLPESEIEPSRVVAALDVSQLNLRAVTVRQESEPSCSRELAA